MNNVWCRLCELVTVPEGEAGHKVPAGLTWLGVSVRSEEGLAIRICPECWARREKEGKE